VCADVPEEISAILERMLAKDPLDRYQTAAEVVHALMPFVNVPDRHGRRSGKLPPLAAAAAKESTAGLNVKHAVEAADTAAALARAQRTAKLAVLGMVGGIAFGVVSLAFALAVYLAK
jgi:serine/threonine-protein kinase